MSRHGGGFKSQAGLTNQSVPSFNKNSRKLKYYFWLGKKYWEGAHTIRAGTAISRIFSDRNCKIDASLGKQVNIDLKSNDIISS